MSTNKDLRMKCSIKTLVVIVMIILILLCFCSCGGEEKVEKTLENSVEEATITYVEAQIASALASLDVTPHCYTSGNCFVVELNIPLEISSQQKDNAAESYAKAFKDSTGMTDTLSGLVKKLEDETGLSGLILELKVIEATGTEIVALEYDVNGLIGIKE